MPFQIIRDDITRVHADAIVNTANPRPVYRAGTDYAIYMAAGAEKLLEERRKIGEIAPGDAAVTPAFALHAKYIIHTVGPVWMDGKHGEAEILASCYRKSLDLALEKNCETVAFPLISSGSYGCPHEIAVKAAVREISSFILEHDMMIYLVVFGEASVESSRKITPQISSYIDDDYVAQKNSFEYGTQYSIRNRMRAPVLREESSCYEAAAPDAGRKPKQDSWVSKLAMPREKQPKKLKDVIAEVEETFQQSVFRIMNEKNMKPSFVYHAANIKKQLWAKFKADENYQPKRNTAICICLALELSLDEAKDLLARAGYAFSPSRGEDLLVMECIRKKNYNIVDIEMQLYDYGLPQLCQYPD